MLEKRAFLKLEKFELLFENYSEQNTFNMQNSLSNQDSSFLTSRSPFPAQNTSQLNNMNNLITPPSKQSVVKFNEDENEEDSQSLWDYVDDLLKAESQSSFKQTPAQKSFVFHEPSSNNNTRESSTPMESYFLMPKETPRKENLMMTSGGKANYCVLDLDEEDEIEALLAQTRQQNNETSHENRNMAERPSSPMIIEQQQPVINIFAPEVAVPQENNNDSQNISQLSRMMISESPNKMRTESTRIEIEEHKTPPPEPAMRSQHFSQRTSFPQSQNLMPFKSLSQHSSQRKSDIHQQSQFLSPAVSKVKQLQQLIEDKRGESASAKNSAVKVSPNQKETRDCSICLCDIDEGGKIDSCTHQFCFTCINDWAKITNQCPLCKGRFNLIEKFSSDGTLLDTVPVIFKQQVYEDENAFQEEMDENCYECENGDDDAHLLVCDHCSFFCCHTYCCVPAFETVPLEDWYCKFCQPAIRRAQRRGGNTNANNANNTNANNTTSRRNRRSNQATTQAPRQNTTGTTGSRRNSRRTTVRQSSLENFIVEDPPRNRTSNRATTQIEEEPPRTTTTRSNRNRRNTSNRTVITIIEDDEDVPIVPRNMSRNQRRLVV